VYGIPPGGGSPERYWSDDRCLLLTTARFSFLHASRSRAPRCPAAPVLAAMLEREQEPKALRYIAEACGAFRDERLAAAFECVHPGDGFQLLERLDHIVISALLQCINDVFF